MGAIGAGWLLIGLGGLTGNVAGLIVLVAGIIALDAGMQAQHITNQSTIYAAVPAARSRVTRRRMG
jgi:hypothetical protein